MGECMKEFNDFQLPDEVSINNLNKGYSMKNAPNVSTLNKEQKERVSDELSVLFNSINQQQNIDFLSMLASRANSPNIRSYLNDILSLNRQDFKELDAIYQNSSVPRNNPTLIRNMPNSFNQILQSYARNELNILSNLTNMMYLEDSQDNKLLLDNILKRRFEALNTVLGFLNNGFFG